MNLNILFQIEVANSLFTVTDKFSELFNQFIFDGHGRKNPMSVFSSWLVENQSLHTADELEVLSLCMSGVVKPLTPKQKNDNADEKIRIEVFDFLNRARDKGEKQTLQQAFDHLHEKLHKDLCGLRTSYFRAVGRRKRGTSNGRFDIIENVDKGQYIIRLILKSSKKLI